MTQLTLPLAPSKASSGQLGRIKARLRAAGRGADLLDLGVSLWLALWAACVSASLVLLLR